jgi:hypothetical protein
LNEDFPAYHLCTAQTFHSNFTLRLKKKLVGFSHYGHFSENNLFQMLPQLFFFSTTVLKRREGQGLFPLSLQMWSSSKHCNDDNIPKHIHKNIHNEINDPSRKEKVESGGPVVVWVGSSRRFFGTFRKNWKPSIWGLIIWTCQNCSKEATFRTETYKK